MKIHCLLFYIFDASALASYATKIRYANSHDPLPLDTKVGNPRSINSPALQWFGEQGRATVL